MESDKIRIELVPGPNDGPLRSSECQQAIRGFEKALRAGGVNPSVGLKFMDAAADALPSAVYSGAFGVAVAALPVLGGCVGAWFKAKSGRKIRVKVDGIEVEASTLIDVERALDKAQEIRERNQPKRIAL